MGVVWAARNVVTEADVALKILLPSEDRKLHAAARFRHEAKLGATLAHRNITRVFDLVHADDGTPALVMERLRGDDLDALTRARGGLGNEEAVAMLVPILAALQHAHERGVIHRDLKPTNIFLHVDPDGHVTPKLLDFGIAKEHQATSLTRTGDTLGTPSYMSPEQVRDSKTIDARTDVFNAGLVLYEAITGQKAFAADSASSALARVLEEEVDPHPRIQPLVWLEIQRALSKAPYGRHASARELATALVAAVGQSEAQLAESLRREPLAPEPAVVLDLPAHEDPEHQAPPGSITAVTQIAGLSSRARALRFAVVGVVAALAVVGGVAMLRPTVRGEAERSAETRPPPPSPKTAATLEQGEGPPPVAPPVPATTAPAPVPASPATGSARAHGRLPRPAPSSSAPVTTAKSPPVARTPGF